MFHCTIFIRPCNISFRMMMIKMINLQSKIDNARGLVVKGFISQFLVSRHFFYWLGFGCFIGEMIVFQD